MARASGTPRSSASSPTRTPSPVSSAPCCSNKTSGPFRPQQPPPERSGRHQLLAIAPCLGGETHSRLSLTWGEVMKTKQLVIAVSLAALVAGCATIIRGVDQQVSVNTNPVGATVQFSSGQNCTSPCTIKAARSQSLMITISLDGCQTQTATMMPTLAGGGVLLGGLIDYGTGAVYDLQPNPLTITLQCGASPSGASPSPPAAARSIVNCVQEDGSFVQVVGTQCPAPLRRAN